MRKMFDAALNRLFSAPKMQWAIVVGLLTAVGLITGCIGECRCRPPLQFASSFTRQIAIFAAHELSPQAGGQRQSVRDFAFEDYQSWLRHAKLAHDSRWLLLRLWVKKVPQVAGDGVQSGILAVSCFYDGESERWFVAEPRGEYDVTAREWLGDDLSLPPAMLAGLTQIDLTGFNTLATEGAKRSAAPVKKNGPPR